ncbi:MAG TPA: twin-arginine translocase TatA/TatE family subunit [Bradyrhizobium sp.]|nr:twin-arginine translocase TatA/TatE family subunit [Bradyrhizobium sp.]
MGADSVWHWIIVIAIVLLLFGRGKVSDLMGDVAHGIKGFKKAMSDEEDDKPSPPNLETGAIDPNAGAQKDERPGTPHD